jgi:hypothetical protein
MPSSRITRAHTQIDLSNATLVAGTNTIDVIWSNVRSTAPCVVLCVIAGVTQTTIVGMFDAVVVLYNTQCYELVNTPSLMLTSV